MKQLKLFAFLPAFATAAGLSIAGLPDTAHADTAPEPGTMHVTKSPTCGCCTAWVALARREGFAVEVTDTRDYVGPKQEAGVPNDLWACHTAIVDGYVVEGHVPFAAVKRMLEERPDIKGISTPGMPAGSPGMGDDPNAQFDVIAFGGEADDGAVFYRAGRE